MGIKMGKTKVEERGRILIPKSIREKAGIRAGEELEIKVEKERIVVKPFLDVKKFSQELEGCIKESKIKPEDIKKIWRM